MQANVTLKRFVDKAEIKQPGMNPWKKNLKRPIFTDGSRFFIRYDGYYGVEINGRNYREVKNVLGAWYL
ncbi:hypothetical protein ACFSL6_17750 [Paenibacillus thailandensis]|uniref:Uncharacterized protein n=1 Tax=Paenibacillus thailandensis TaxID=393250 RepID=A0ABW5QTA4_9BACL